MEQKICHYCKKEAGPKDMFSAIPEKIKGSTWYRWSCQICSIKYHGGKNERVVSVEQRR
jgi:hypothetical protein